MSDQALKARPRHLPSSGFSSDQANSLELTILTPCLNEAETVAVCVSKARRFLERTGIEGEVLVADNGSSDGSSELARDAGARVVHIARKGYGSALLGGIRAAYGKFVTSRPAAKPPANTTYLVSRALVPDNTDHSADRTRQEAIDVVLDRLEDACPELFQPRRLPTDYRGDAGRRIYLNTDLMAWVGKRGVKLFFDPARGDDPVFLGREDDWLKAPPRLACARRNGHFIVRVLDSKETQ
jgi:glycosyltransferase involved in cell wall biosynthesis